jgi:hypothetical protein
MKNMIIRFVAGTMTMGLVLGFDVIALGSTTFAATISSWAQPIKIFPHPPKGFNPLTASNQEFAQYGFPKKPSNAASLQSWKQAMTRAKQEVAPNPVVGTQKWASLSGTSDGNWAGHGNLASNNGNITYDNGNYSVGA